MEKSIIQKIANWVNTTSLWIRLERCTKTRKNDRPESLRVKNKMSFEESRVKRKSTKAILPTGVVMEYIYRQQHCRRLDSNCRASYLASHPNRQIERMAHLLTTVHGRSKSTGVGVVFNNAGQEVLVTVSRDTVTRRSSGPASTDSSTAV